MKTPYEVFGRFLPKPTPADEAAARGLGVDIDTYMSDKMSALFRKPAAPEDDIAVEAAEAQRLRARPGIIKPRGTPPNLLVQAWRTPGDVAGTMLFVFCYIVGLAALVIVGGERAQALPGIFQVVLLGLLVIPARSMADRLWRALGERGRSLVRTLIRFWPLTLIALVYLLGMLGLARRQFLP